MSLTDILRFSCNRTVNEAAAKKFAAALAKAFTQSGIAK